MKELNELTALETKIYFGEHLSEDELKDAVFELEKVKEIPRENRRWTRYMSSIFQVADKFFEIDWEEGLTEEQEDMYNNQPYQVYKHEHVVKETKVWYDTHKE